jgi:hypothetical protein
MRQRATCHPAGGAATVATACQPLTAGRPRQFASREACGREAVTMQDDDARELTLAEALRRWFLADAREAALFDWWGALAPEKRSRLNVQAAFERRTAGPGLSLKRDGFLHKAVVQPDGSTQTDIYLIPSKMMQGRVQPREIADVQDYLAAWAAAIGRLNAAMATGGYELLFYKGRALPHRLSTDTWRAGGLCLTPETVLVNRAGQHVARFSRGRFFVAKASDAVPSATLPAVATTGAPAKGPGKPAHRPEKYIWEPLFQVIRDLFHEDPGASDAEIGAMVKCKITHRDIEMVQGGAAECPKTTFARKVRDRIVGERRERGIST